MDFVHLPQHGIPLIFHPQPNRYSNWNPGKWTNGLKPVVLRPIDFDPWFRFGHQRTPPLGSVSGKLRFGFRTETAPCEQFLRHVERRFNRTPTPNSTRAGGVPLDSGHTAPLSSGTWVTLLPYNSAEFHGQRLLSSELSEILRQKFSTFTLPPTQHLWEATWEDQLPLQKTSCQVPCEWGG